MHSLDVSELVNVPSICGGSVNRQLCFSLLWVIACGPQIGSMGL